MNALLREWDGVYRLPPFETVRDEDFAPAFDAALAEARANIDAIAADPETPTFANTIEAMERAEQALDRVCAVFFNLAGADTNDAIEALQRDLSPRLAAHHSETMMNAALFARVDALMARRAELGLTAEQDRVLDLYHRMFVRAGARLTGADRDAAEAEILQRLATSAPLSARTCCADEKAWTLPLAADDLEGLPDDPRRAAAQAAAERGHGRPRGHAVAQPDRAVPAVLAAPRPARDGVPRLGRARRERRRDRQPRRSSPRRWRCARSGRGCSATRTSPPTSSSRRWRRRRRRCATC